MFDSIENYYRAYNTNFALKKSITKKMPGTIVFKPVEFLINDEGDHVGKEAIEKMDPYCKFKIGWHSKKTHITKPKGNQAHWNDSVTFDRKNDESYAHVEIKDQGRLGSHATIGEAKIDLEVAVANGRVSQWYYVKKNEKIVGEIFIDIECSEMSPKQ